MDGSEATIYETSDNTPADLDALAKADKKMQRRQAKRTVNPRREE